MFKKKEQVIEANRNFEVYKKTYLMKEGEFSTYNDKMLLEISRKCKPNALVVYICLYSHLNKKTGICNPSIDTIQAETGIASNKTINTLLNKLKEEGYIDWVQVKTKTNAFKNNHYAFTYKGVLRDTAIVKRDEPPRVKGKCPIPKKDKKVLTPPPRINTLNNNPLIPKNFKVTEVKEEIEETVNIKQVIKQLKKVKEFINKEYGKTQYTGPLTNFNNTIKRIEKNMALGEFDLSFIKEAISILTGRKYILNDNYMLEERRSEENAGKDIKEKIENLINDMKNKNIWKDVYMNNLKWMIDNNKINKLYLDRFSNDFNIYNFEFKFNEEKLIIEEY